MKAPSVQDLPAEGGSIWQNQHERGLPHPLSPTSPINSPSFKVKLIFSTARAGALPFVI
ncbi:MAG: hypothetical protein IPL17_21155 [Anaerolineales bacterium]|nr:hypothetical protein [Anaerolineales bacterium]